MEKRYYKIMEYCVELTNSSTNVTEYERQLFGGWNTLLRVFQMPSVQDASLHTFEQIADLLDGIAEDVLVPSADQYDDDDAFNDESRVAGLALGLARRAADDCRAIALLGEHQLVRQAAGLCRSLYEAFGWIDLLLDGEGGEKAARLYEFLHHEAVLRGRFLEVENRISLMDEVRQALNDEPVVPIQPSVLKAGGEAYLDTMKAEIRRLKEDVPKGRRGRQRHLPNCYLKVAEYFDSVDARRYKSLWSATIYYPACRLVHAADALDYVDLYEEGGVVADLEPKSLPGSIGSPEGILAATAYRLVLSLPAFHDWMTGFYWEGDGEDEQRRHADKGIALAMRATAHALKQFIGPMSEA